MLDTGADFSLVAAERLLKAALTKMETVEVEGCQGAGGDMIRIKGQLIGGPYDSGNAFPESTRKGHIRF